MVTIPDLISPCFMFISWLLGENICLTVTLRLLRADLLFFFYMNFWRRGLAVAFDRSTNKMLWSCV